MFGDALLVAPVYKPENNRTVYLPEGKWYDYETGKEYGGPQTLRIEPSLDLLPLYVKENSILPMGPEMVYVGQKPFDPITLDIWLSSEAECTLYDDDEKARTQEIVQCRASRKGNQDCTERRSFGQNVYRQIQQDQPPETRQPERQGYSAYRFTTGAGKIRDWLVLRPIVRGVCKIQFLWNGEGPGSPPMKDEAKQSPVKPSREDNALLSQKRNSCPCGGRSGIARWHASGGGTASLGAV